MDDEVISRLVEDAIDSESREILTMSRSRSVQLNVSQPIVILLMEPRVGGELGLIGKDKLKFAFDDPEFNTSTLVDCHLVVSYPVASFEYFICDCFRWYVCELALQKSALLLSIALCLVVILGLFFFFTAFNHLIVGASNKI